jgi:hypothetical protein
MGIFGCGSFARRNIMDRAIDSLFRTENIWVLIPLLGIVCGTLLGLIKLLRPAPDVSGVEELRAEVAKLRERVEKLERQNFQPGTFTPGRPGH